MFLVHDKSYGINVKVGLMAVVMAIMYNEV